MHIYESVIEYINKKRKGMLVTVVRREGSAPRDVGAKMFVGEEGLLIGTIGGGRLEHEAYGKAMAAMGCESAMMIHIRMDGAEVASEGMLCGGNVDVMLEPVLARHSEIYRKLASYENSGRRGIIVTKINNNEYAKTLVNEDLTTTGDEIGGQLAEECPAFIAEGRLFAGNGFVVEPIITLSPLYIFGAGHVSQYIAAIAKLVDFSVTVIDDRVEFANKERFGEDVDILVAGFQEVFAKLPFTGREFIVIVTRGHQHDSEVLRRSLGKDVRYRGMIGSKRKVKIVMDHMKNEGFSHELLESVYAPIGISIGAETPQEIAVSIVAELIKVRGE